MEQNRKTLDDLVNAINDRDLEALNAVFTDDVVLEWPQSNERIVGNSNRREIYQRFPTLPKFSNHRVRGSDDLLVLEADLDYGEDSKWLATFVFEMREGKIAHETGYWSQALPPADWRARWVEPIRT